MGFGTCLVLSTMWTWALGRGSVRIESVLTGSGAGLEFCGGKVVQSSLSGGTPSRV